MENSLNKTTVVNFYLPPSWAKLKGWQKEFLKALALESCLTIVVRKESFSSDLFVYNALRQLLMEREELVRRSLMPGLSLKSRDEISDEINLRTLRAEALINLMVSCLKVKFGLGSGRLSNPISVDISEALTERGIKLEVKKPGQVVTIEKARERRRVGFFERSKGLKK